MPASGSQCPSINGVFRPMPAFSLFAILGVAALRLRLRNRCGLGLNRNPPFLDGHYLTGCLKTSIRPSARATIGWRLGGWNARRLKKGRNGFASSFPASQPSIFRNKTHLQQPHNTASRPQARFFNSLRNRAQGRTRSCHGRLVEVLNSFLSVCNSDRMNALSSSIAWVRVSGETATPGAGLAGAGLGVLALPAGPGWTDARRF
jgi:hypothetical protein